MRIESVEILNYRQYRNVTYTFKKQGEYDLHIIKGKNGMGKTNLLNAITWCIYGSEPHLGIKNSGQPKINTKALNEAREKGEAQCEVCVRVTISDDREQISFERKGKFNTGEDLFEHKTEFSVARTNGIGETKVYTDKEMVDDLVDVYLKRDISEYFFFDGEQLDKYFIEEQGEKIKEAIQVISQVRLLTNMKDRLKSVISDFNKEAGKKNKDIKGLVKQEEELEGRLENSNKSIQELTQQIAVSERTITECVEFLRGKEGIPEKEKEFDDLREELEEKNNEKRQLEIEMHKFIRRYKTLLSLYPAIKETYDIICERDKKGAFPPSVDKKFLEEMLGVHRCLVCDRELEEHSENRINQLIDKISMANKPSLTLYGIKNELENIIDETKEYKVKKENLFRRKKKLEDYIGKLNDKLEKLDIELKKFTDKEKIKEKHQERMDHMRLLEINRKKKLEYEFQVEKDQKELKEIKDKIDKAIESNKEFEVINQKIQFATSAREIVSQIEDEMMNEVKEKIKERTLSIFSDLEWKEEIFERIELDEKYNLELYDADGFPMLGTCSAGERALLALSFTLALQKVSGYDSMLFIDTPVGRIDTENRVNFSSVLKNVSKNKQVIITLTTSEYSREIQEVFEPINSSFVELQSEDKKVTILGGVE